VARGLRARHQSMAPSKRTHISRRDFTKAIGFINAANWAQEKNAVLLARAIGARSSLLSYTTPGSLMRQIRAKHALRTS
jgi:hypothetical protein